MHSYSTNLLPETLASRHDTTMSLYLVPTFYRTESPLSFSSPFLSIAGCSWLFILSPSQLLESDLPVLPPPSFRHRANPPQPPPLPLFPLRSHYCSEPGQADVRARVQINLHLRSKITILLDEGVSSDLSQVCHILLHLCLDYFRDLIWL